MVGVCVNNFAIATNSPEPQPFRYDEDSGGRVKVVPYAQVSLLRLVVECVIECADAQCIDIQIRTWRQGLVYEIWHRSQTGTLYRCTRIICKTVLPCNRQ